MMIFNIELAKNKCLSTIWSTEKIPVSVFEPYLDLFQSLYDFFAEIRNYSTFCWHSLPVHSGSLKRIDYPKTAVWPTLFLLNVSAALKGTHNYIFIWTYLAREHYKNANFL